MLLRFVFFFVAMPFYVGLVFLSVVKLLLRVVRLRVLLNVFGFVSLFAFVCLLFAFVRLFAVCFCCLFDVVLAFCFV